MLHSILFNDLMTSIPSRDKNKLSAPSSFSQFGSCRVVIDCTDIEIATPGLMSQQNATYSNDHHHHHLAASMEIEFTTPFQNTLSVIAVRRSILAMAVSLEVMSGKVSFLDRFSVDGCLHKRNDDTSSSEARAQCPANWMHLLWTRVDILGRSPYIILRVGCFSRKDLTLS